MGASTLPLITAGLASGGNLISTILTNKSNQQNVNNTNQTNLGISEQQIAAQQQENALNRQFNADQATLSYQRQNQLWEKQANYYSPINIVKRLQEAGVNPAVFFGGGTTTAQSSPSSVAGASYSSGLSPVMPNLTAFKSIAPQVGSDVIDAIQKLSSASRDRADANKTNATLSAYLDSLKQSTEGQRIANSVQQNYGNLLAESQVAESVHRALLLMKQAELAQSENDLTKEKKFTEQAQQELNRASSNLKGEQARNMQLANQTFMQEFEQRMKESRARENKANAEATTENTLRYARLDVLRADSRMQNASAAAQELVNTLNDSLDKDGYLINAKRSELMSIVNEEHLKKMSVQEKEAVIDYIIKQEEIAANLHDASSRYFWQDLLKSILSAGGSAAAAYVGARYGKR